MEVEIVVALITAFASLAITVIGYFFTRSNQKSLALIKDEFEERKAEKDARRDYSYDARKRLYRECEPLFFLLNEMSENALGRIYSLARTAREGNLDIESGWLAAEGYYFGSTMYKLLSPLTIYKLIQHRLTLVDLSVDPNVKNRYELIKCIYYSFTDDFEFANADPLIEYNPNLKDAYEKRESEPEKYWRQGIYSGNLDKAVESLIVGDPGNILRCMSFGEFEESFHQKESDVNKAFWVIRDLFCQFHPKTRPVLWRILVTQFHLYVALARASSTKESSLLDDLKLIKDISETQRKQFDWRSSEEEASNREVLVDPFEVSKTYIENYFKLYLP